MILILYTQIDATALPGHYSSYYSLLPACIREKINCYRNEADKIPAILGKQLLSDALKKLGVPGDHLDSIQYKKNNRPYFYQHPGIDFNISHSGSFVICAVSTEARLGIDIERRKPVNLANFKTYFSPGEWDQLENALNPQGLFYQYWVQKESLIKADDSVLPTQFSEIQIYPGRAILNHRIWYLTRIPIHQDYDSWLAADRLPGIAIEQMKY